MLENKEFTIEGYDFTFRIMDMNAIEAFAIQSQFDFSTFDNAKKLINVVLEHIEVKAGEKWLPVKMKDKAVYVPDKIENDIKLVKSLMSYFSDKYLEGLFQQSDESK